MAEDQDRQVHAAAPDLYSLFNIRHRQIFRAEILQRAADRHRTVAIGVGLHHAEKPASGGKPASQLLVVVFQIVQADIRPGSH